MNINDDSFLILPINISRNNKYGRIFDVVDFYIRIIAFKYKKSAIKL